MNVRGLLNADMRTLGRWLTLGWQWWLDELGGLVPERWRARAGRSLPRFVLRDGTLVPEAGPAGPRARAGLCAVIVVPRDLCLVRHVERPFARPRDLQGMLALEGETLLPLPADSVVVAGRMLRPTVPGRMMVEVAGLPVEAARRIHAAVSAADMTACAVALEGPDGGPPLDFLPALRTRGLFARRRSATPLVWGLVALLVAVNIGVFIGRDVAQTRQLERLIEEQQPAVTTAQAIRRRIEADRRLITTTLALRQRHEPLTALAHVSKALPPGAWLQRLAWDGETLRMTGYRPVDADVTSALRRSGRFVDVRALTDEVQAATPAGIPFDVSARPVPR